jgi:asparagine synthase (glutamine-hydrolysing)
MYLVCKYIREKTEVRVLLTGEVSDEMFGYKYTDFAPDAKAFQDEAAKRIRELYFYDVLRADRCIAAHGLEARVPFSDTAFVQYVMSIDPKLKMNTTGVGKYLLRMSFQEAKILPESILMREKAAFSDAVGHSMVDILKAYADAKYSDEEFKTKSSKLGPITPISKEGLLYREIFSSYYPGREGMIPAYWLPNSTWTNCGVLDPSARYLPNYGASGH